VPVEMKIGINDGEVRTLLSRLQRKTSNLTPAMRIIGEIVQTSIQRNFEAGGRPKRWLPLAAATIRQRRREGHWPGPILVRHGVSGGLMGSISYRASGDRVVLSANKIYAAIHHFGGMAGRGHKTRIPARPFMFVHDRDWIEIKDALRKHLEGI